MKWQRSGSEDQRIASIMLSDYEPYARAVERLVAGNSLPYSGIVLSDSPYADGSKVEKSCYSKGGFKFLYRSYMETDIGDAEFPTRQLTSLLEKLAVLYLVDVVGSRGEKTYLDVCWAVCQRAGDYGTLHHHIAPGQDGGPRYSGMFYLRTPPSINPETFPDGCLHLVTPAEIVYVPPIPGSIVLWPSHLIHGIHPFKGEGDRLGIAFDFVSK